MMLDRIADPGRTYWPSSPCCGPGDFGVLDSDRDDVEYEDFHGHKLDRRLLELLRRY